MSTNDIGVNYAAAFIESLKTVEEVRKGGDDLETFSALLQELPSMARVLEHPGMPLERRKGILDEALAQIDAHPTSRRLFHLIVENGRLRDTRSIAARFAELRDARLNVAGAEVVTAVPLDSASRAEWEATLARLTGRRVRVAYRTDGSLLGGALTRVGSTVYDGSVRKQIERIRGILLKERGQ